MTIWKYPLTITGEQVVLLPANHNILSVQFQDGVLCMWALVDPASGDVSVRVRIVGTGHPFDGHEHYFHVGTVQQGMFVWHVFVEE